MAFKRKQSPYYNYRLMKVLITEDEEILLTAIEFRLKKQGYDTLFVENGESVITSIERTKPDLLVLSLESQNLDFFQLITTLRSNKNNPVPIILIAALESGENILKAMRLGVEDFVTKPFKPAELVLRVRKIFEEQGMG